MGEVRAQNAPTSGTSIKNQVTTTYSETGDTTPIEILSNEVNVVVDATIDFALELNNSLKRFRGKR